MPDLKSSRQVFLTLSLMEQISALFDMVFTGNNDRANDQKEHIELRADIQYLKGELQGIGRRKDKTLTTSDKLNVILDKRAVWWVWYRDHVLAPTLAIIQTTIVLYILYSAFGGKAP